MANEKSTENFKEEVVYTTETNYQNFKLEWIIKEFESVCREMQVIESARFPSRNANLGQWFICFFPVELTEKNEENCRFLLQCTDNVPRYISFNITLFRENIETDKYSLTSNLQKYTQCVELAVPGSTLYASLNCDNYIHCQSNIRIVCELSVFHSVQNVFEKPTTDPPKFEDVVEQLEQFFSNDDLKDIIFSVDETEFRAHKAILALRSPVFAEMVKNQEKTEWISIIKITDTSASIFEKLLRFVYSEKVENLEEIALEMFHAAEKYQLNKLKFMCVDSLRKSISMENVIKTLELADEFSICNLKEKSLKFLVSNLQKIRSTAEFIKLMKERPHLSIEIVEMKNVNVNKEEESKKVSEKTNFEFRK